MKSMGGFIYFLGYSLLFFPYIVGEQGTVFACALMFCGVSSILLSDQRGLRRFPFFVSLIFLILTTYTIWTFDLSVLTYGLLPFIIIGYASLIPENRFLSLTSHLQLYYFLTVIIALLGIYQFFVDPSLWGLSKNTVYTEELHGTTNFRVSSLFGSVQNNALLLGAALFIQPNCNEYIHRISKLIISIAGLLTLSTFFGGCLILFLQARIPYWLKVSLFILAASYLSTLSFTNTIFESFSFAEVLDFDNRYHKYEIDMSFYELVFGKGMGFASQGLIDRGLVPAGYLKTESSILSFTYERGILFSFFLVLIGAYRCLKDVRLYGLKDYRSYFFLVILINFMMTPTLTSARIMLIFFTIFVLPSQVVSNVSNISRRKSGVLFARVRACIKLKKI